MFSCLWQIDDLEPRLAGMEHAVALAQLRPRQLSIDLTALPLDGAVAALPLMGALARLASLTRVSIEPASELATLLAQALPAGATGEPWLRVRLAPGPGAAVPAPGPRVMAPLRADLSRGDILSVDDWRRAGLAHGIAVPLAPPKLALERPATRTARAWLRRAIGLWSGPAVAIALADPSPHVETVAGALLGLTHRIGAVPIVVGGPAEVSGARPPHTWSTAERAALVALAAVVIGDDPTWTALAPALGVPALRIRAASHGAARLAMVCWGSAAAQFAAVARRFRFATDCNPRNLGQLAELLAALRWP
ncbi:MAG: hypothetical protein HYZ27_03305, partial [Deltaproteobacteria bacterium]|nr:hypothetical protein [Deltaproteobacteria bacterium]